MIILMTAALAAAQPAPVPQGKAMPAEHMAMGHGGKGAHMKCCDCCKDMAEHDGPAEHERHHGE